MRAVRSGRRSWPGIATRTRPAPGLTSTPCPARTSARQFDDETVERFLVQQGLPHERLSPEDRAERVAGLLADGAVVGWMQGRMEFGPRALGNRSILADPRRPSMQRELNLKIKFRESFRPFAPSVLANRAADHFELRPPEPLHAARGAGAGSSCSPTRTGCRDWTVCTPFGRRCQR